MEISRLLMQGLPSLVAGDFNCIVGPHEKHDGRQEKDSVESKKFRELITSTGLIDLGFMGSREFVSSTRLINLEFMGSRFSWCNNKHGTTQIWERIVELWFLLTGSSAIWGILFNTC